MSEFWTGAVRVLRAALPAHWYIYAGLRVVGTTPTIALRTRLGPAPPDYLAGYLRVNPGVPYLLAHPGTRILRLSDVVSDAALQSGEMYTRYMRPEGWRHSVALFFWERARLRGYVGLHRTAAQGDFHDREVRLLSALYRHLAVAFRRVAQLERARAARRALEGVLRHLPLPALILDWALAPVYRNRAAEEVCALWNFGARGRGLKASALFRIPPAVLGACEALRVEATAVLQGAEPQGPLERTVEHPGPPRLGATVSLVERRRSATDLPRLFVRFDAPHPAHAAAAADGPAFARWANLSGAEREVARLVCEGLSNREIAERLHRSVLTVKTQLRSIFEKLDVPNRSRLAVVLR